MEFLDPKARRNRSIRLMIGYTLMTILIFTATTVLVYRTYGFNFDRKTGEVIQSGLVYADSAPDKGFVYLNGEQYKDQTNTRISLVEGNYNLAIKKDGYRDWQKDLIVKGGSVARLVYPLLIPNDLTESEVIASGTNSSVLRTESPDRRYILVQDQANLSSFVELDLKNINKITKNPTSRSIVLPEDLMTKSDVPGSLELVEWSNDNDHLLVKHIYSGTYEFMLLSRKQPETSININKFIEKTPKKVSLRDKKFDKWYVWSNETGDITAVDTKKATNNIVFSATAYKTHDENTIVYAQKSKDNTQTIYIKTDNGSYQIRKVNEGNVNLEIAKYEGDWYVAIASDGDKKTYIYKNPQNILEKNPQRTPAPISILRASEPINDLAFSSNTRFIFARDGQRFSVYDAEDDQRYSFSPTETLEADTPVKWMDGHRLIYRSNGLSYYIEFDGKNKQALVSATPGISTFFDRDYTVLYSFAKSKSNPANFVINKTDLRYEQDK